jgi:hypothetical protein
VSWLFLPGPLLLTASLICSGKNPNQNSLLWDAVYWEILLISGWPSCLVACVFCDTCWVCCYTELLTVFFVAGCFLVSSLACLLVDSLGLGLTFWVVVPVGLVWALVHWYLMVPVKWGLSLPGIWVVHWWFCWFKFSACWLTCWDPFWCALLVLVFWGCCCCLCVISGTACAGTSLPLYAMLPLVWFVWFVMSVDCAALFGWMAGMVTDTEMPSWPLYLI